ncbi:MAG: hypothetical protein RL495_809 [Verrucomicrobiota bacterium]
MSSLFSPLKVGALTLPNRILMAPLTGCRAEGANVPTDLMAEYYAQRASAGLIIAEATTVSPRGHGYPNTPGIYTDEQVAGWKKVTSAVHAKGGRIFLQLWHVGRISHPDYQPNGELPVAPSAIKPKGQLWTGKEMADYVVPRALHIEEIPGIVAEYVRGARLAKEAGFDGVEIHNANGYLLDQFLRSGTNTREDGYGNSLAARASASRPAACSMTCPTPIRPRPSVTFSANSPSLSSLTRTSRASPPRISRTARPAASAPRNCVRTLKVCSSPPAVSIARRPSRPLPKVGRMPSRTVYRSFPILISRGASRKTSRSILPTKPPSTPPARRDIRIIPRRSKRR